MVAGTVATRLAVSSHLINGLFFSQLLRGPRLWAGANSDVTERFAGTTSSAVRQFRMEDNTDSTLLRLRECNARLADESRHRFRVSRPE